MPAKNCLSDIKNYIAEVRVPEKSDTIGKLVRDLDDEADDNDIAIIGLVRGGRRYAGQARLADIQAGAIFWSSKPMPKPLTAL